MTRQEAEKLGWAFTVDGEDGHAENESGSSFDVTSEIPMFFMLLEIARREGQPIDDSDVTPELVAAVSGETYKPPPPEPVVAEAPTFSDALEQALAGIDPAKITATDPLSQAIKAVLLASRGG